MLRSWKLGTAFGIGVYVHWTFLLLLGFVVAGEVSAGDYATAAFEAGLVLAIFGCVTLHELGHALMARVYGIGTRDITLYPIGGVARVERLSERPVEEFWIALAGPAVNLVIAGVLALVLRLQGLFGPASLLASWTQSSFLRALMVSNLVLMSFNLLPVFPSDGGRILRALLATRLGGLRATRLAASIGAGLAGFLFLGGLFPQALLRPIAPGIFGDAESLPTLMLVAGFLFLAGRQELAAVERREAMDSLRPIEICTGTPRFEAPRFVAAGGFTGFTWDSRSRLWVQWQDGRPVSTIPVE